MKLQFGVVLALLALFAFLRYEVINGGTNLSIYPDPSTTANTCANTIVSMTSNWPGNPAGLPTKNDPNHGTYTATVTFTVRKDGAPGAGGIDMIYSPFIGGPNAGGATTPTWSSYSTGSLSNGAFTTTLTVPYAEFVGRFTDSATGCTMDSRYFSGIDVSAGGDCDATWQVTLASSASDPTAFAKGSSATVSVLHGGVAVTSGTVSIIAARDPFTAGSSTTILSATSTGQSLSTAMPDFSPASNTGKGTQVYAAYAPPAGAGCTLATSQIFPFIDTKATSTSGGGTTSSSPMPTSPTPTSPATPTSSSPTLPDSTSPSSGGVSPANAIATGNAAQIVTAVNPVRVFPTFGAARWIAFGAGLLVAIAAIPALNAFLPFLRFHILPASLQIALGVTILAATYLTAG